MVKVSSIKDINDQYDYKDEMPNGEGDSELVACGQNGNYNELSYIYKEKLESEVKSGAITEQAALDALNKACANVKNPRSREDFYSYLEQELGITIT
ncbi:hypothetical protein [Larsenimonas rhizosphaerae]|uniref:hypothetical protein n=1 Tax=Larsenimonas rhizosphaerae TaxID=2944682 RepID=UPI00203413EA|nr:hypothetical protein [Larsenimonas rhizosphaerae]MCM2131962.1 hypothetical protein [Larsenimonas rhizosphaerae]